MVAGIAAPASSREMLERLAAMYQVKVTIIDIEPAVWRRVVVPAETTLAKFHQVIQATFGWWNYHLHQYIVDGEHFGVPDPENAEELPPMKDEHDIALRDIIGASKIVYEYDFDHSWEHLIEIENVAVHLRESGRHRPDFIAGKHKRRPPEDCAVSYQASPGLARDLGGPQARGAPRDEDVGGQEVRSGEVRPRRGQIARCRVRASAGPHFAPRASKGDCTDQAFTRPQLDGCHRSICESEMAAVSRVALNAGHESRRPSLATASLSALYKSSVGRNLPEGASRPTEGKQGGW